MEKLLGSDWLRSMQFSGNSVQKRVNSVQKRVNSVQRKKQTRHSDWSIIKETRVLSRFSFATAAEKQLKQSKHCKRYCFLVVGLEKVVFREGNCRGNRKLRADPA